MSSELPKTGEEESKHKVLFLTPEEAAEPSKVQLGEPEEHPPGLILPSGEINWNCPCLGGMAIGPCGVEFRDAFSCFHYSEAEVKGSDCLEQFAEMQKCMQSKPELFEDKREAKEPEPPAEEAKAEEPVAKESETDKKEPETEVAKAAPSD